MMTPTHRRLGAATVLGLHTAAVGAALTPAGVLVAAVAAAVFSGGPTSPDVDNQPGAKAADRRLPDEALGHGGPLGHRRLAHWWGLPTALGVAYALGSYTVGYHPPALVWAALWGAWVGWLSHLPGDAVFGQGNWRYGLPKGIPLMPWWRHVGLGVKCGGKAERVVGRILAVAVAAGLVATAIGWHPAH